MSPIRRPSVLRGASIEGGLPTLVSIAAAMALVVPCSLSTTGCEEPQSAGPAASASSSAAAPPPEASTLTPAQRLARQDKAAKLFRIECSGCHGERGRGDGPAASFVVVKPRNFTRERFKVRSVLSGGPPTKKDIFDTITRGMPGSSMPSFKFLSDDERWLLTEHVWELANLEGRKPGKPAPMTKEVPNDAESIKRGRAIFEQFECAKCHGAEGRGDGPSSKTLKDDLDRPLPSRDLTREAFRGGDGIEATYFRFMTGMDGTPMPSYADNFKGTEGWDLAHYVVSLRVPKEAPPSDAVEYGRKVVQDKQCQACHVIEGKGARVGPSLDVSAQKLQYAWAKAFLKSPRTYGKVYPYIPYRMPDLGLTEPEIDAVLALFAKIANRSYPDDTPKPVAIDEAKAKAGMLIYFLKCTECHNMGTVIPTPEAKRQGPDLVDVTKRMRFEFMPQWVKQPQDVYADTRMVDTNLSADEVDQVVQFVWKTSLENAGKVKPTTK